VLLAMLFAQERGTINTVLEVIPLILKMERASSSETLSSICQRKWGCIPNGTKPQLSLIQDIRLLLLLLPLALQPVVGFSLSNNIPRFCPICQKLSPSSHFQHLKISFYFFSPSFRFGHPIILHSFQVTQTTYPLPLYPFYYIFSFTHLF